jgi:hypothetical protein
MKRTKTAIGFRQVCATMLIVPLFLLLVAAIPSAEGYTITTTIESGNGKIKPTSPTVGAGQSKTITMKPGKGWHVSQVTLDDATAVYDKDDRLALASVTVKRKNVKYRLQDVAADHILKVTFEQDRTYSLSLSVQGSGRVKARPGGLACQAGETPCAAAYTEDNTVKLIAKPSKGYLFAGWSGSASGINKKGRVVMNADKNVTATFAAKSAAAAALKVAEKISVVDAKDGTAGQNSTGKSAGSVPPDSDYEQDETFSFVEENSVQSFDTMNEILCMMAQTKYGEMLNAGTYKALIDMNQCKQERDDASSADGEDSQSSGSSMPDYEQWTVDSSRDSNGSPHIVKAWIHESADKGGGEGGGEPAKLIYTKTEITEAASEANPYGIFTVNFEAYPISEGAAAVSKKRRGAKAGKDPMFKGYLRAERGPSGEVLLKFATESGAGSEQEMSEKATLSRHESGGRGSTRFRFASGPWVEEGNYDIAFSDDYFLRSDGTESVCFDRNNFDETAWRYGLYDSATGSRVSPRSGFPVTLTEGGKEYYGWVGYWGMWFPEELELESGTTVYKQNFGGEGNVPYQLFIAQGKLRKHTKKLLALEDVKNIPLDMWDDSEQKNYRTIWNGTEFEKVAVFSEENGMWAELEPPQTMDLGSLNYDTLFFWSNALGGNVRIKLDCTSSEAGPGQITFDCSPNDSSTVVLFEETVMYPGDSMPSSLACMSQCPNGANSATGSVFFDDSQLQFQNTAPASANYIAYTFDQDTMLLMHGATEIIQTVQNANSQWDIRSGPMFEPTEANLQQLACEWDQSGSSTCGWQAWDNLDEYYSWETGPNDWNRFTALKNDSGEFEKFEPPLPVQYVHEQTDADAYDYKYNGTTFYLEYNGFGDLHGIPGRCVDMQTGEDTSCGPETRWIPELTIPDGSEMQGDEASYLAKALEKEQRMRKVETSDCSSLSLVSYTLPSISDWVAPKIGSEPVVDGPPAVVGGVVQE